MPIDHAATENFIWSAARLVDCRRYSLLFKSGPAEPVIDALRAYRNPDGGFGQALEPGLRSPGSQPTPTLYALEILNEAGAADGELARDAGQLDLSSLPGSRSRGLVSEAQVEAHLDAVESGQQEDGGWDVRLACLVTGADDRLAWQRHDSMKSWRRP